MYVCFVIAMMCRCLKLNYKLLCFAVLSSSLNLLKPHPDWFWSLGSFACDAMIESMFHHFVFVGPVWWASSLGLDSNPVISFWARCRLFLWRKRYCSSRLGSSLKLFF